MFRESLSDGAPPTEEELEQISQEGWHQLELELEQMWEEDVNQRGREPA
jgi:hypothetical protein